MKKNYKSMYEEYIKGEIFIKDCFDWYTEDNITTLGNKEFYPALKYLKESYSIVNFVNRHGIVKHEDILEKFKKDMEKTLGCCDDLVSYIQDNWYKEEVCGDAFLTLESFLEDVYDYLIVELIQKGKINICFNKLDEDDWGYCSNGYAKNYIRKNKSKYTIYE